MAWKTIESIAAFEDLSHQASTHSYAIFKHSTTCPVSAAAKRRLEIEWEKESVNLEIYYLDLLANRPLSNLIAERLEVVHQSPQLIVVKDGKVVYHASHLSISASKAAKALEC